MNNVVMNLNSPEWVFEKNTARYKLNLRGAPHLDGDLINTSDMLDKLVEKNDISSNLNKINGFYSAILESENHLIVAVDHIRSMPLFYAEYKELFYLSDNAEWVREQISDNEIDIISCEEFQLTGYVTGRDTLFKKIKQVQAGEYLIVCQVKNNVRVECSRYFTFSHSNPIVYDKAALWKKLNTSAISSIENLIKYANGRQIVVPLSGGYDSRLIISLLKKKKYENVLTFTYGILNNVESEYSKEIAHQLGFKWFFVEYNDDIWRETWKTDERKTYQRWASGWVSIAHFQDWIAVKKLKENNLLDDDCIFAPGHTGDFIAGGHIPEIAVSGKRSSIEELTQSVFRKHYSQAPAKIVGNTSNKAWEERILDRSAVGKVVDGEQLADAFEKWEWQERQAKFICNSVRVYEYFGYNWWLPLWDMEFVKNWQEIPLELRKGKYWYNEYVNKTYQENSEGSINALTNNAATISKMEQMIIKVGKIIVSNLPDFIRKNYFLGKVIKNHTQKTLLASYGRYDDKEVYKLKILGYSLNGINAKKFLQENFRKENN